MKTQYAIISEQPVTIVTLAQETVTLDGHIDVSSIASHCKEFSERNNIPVVIQNIETREGRHLRIMHRLETNKTLVCVAGHIRQYVPDTSMQEL